MSKERESLIRSTLISYITLLSGSEPFSEEEHLIAHVSQKYPIVHEFSEMIQRVFGYVAKNGYESLMNRTITEDSAEFQIFTPWIDGKRTTGSMREEAMGNPMDAEAILLGNGNGPKTELFLDVQSERQWINGREVSLPRQPRCLLYAICLHSGLARTRVLREEMHEFAYEMKTRAIHSLRFELCRQMHNRLKMMNFTIRSEGGRYTLQGVRWLLIAPLETLPEEE